MTVRPAASPGEGELEGETQRLGALVEESERCERRAEEALVESQSRLNDALRAADVATWDWTPSSNVMSASETDPDLRPDSRW